MRQSSLDHPATDGGIGKRIDQNETSGQAAELVRIEEQRTAGFEFDAGDFVHLDFAGGFAAERVDVDAIMYAPHSSLYLPGGVLQEVAAAELQRRLPQPHQHSVEALGYGRRSVGRDEHVAATDIDF